MPNDPNALIYPGKRGPNQRIEQVAIKWIDGEPASNSALNREKYALRELGLHFEEEEE